MSKPISKSSQCRVSYLTPGTRLFKGSFLSVGLEAPRRFIIAHAKAAQPKGSSYTSFLISMGKAFITVLITAEGKRETNEDGEEYRQSYSI